MYIHLYILFVLFSISQLSRVRKASAFKELMFYLYLSQSVYIKIKYIYPPLFPLVCFFSPPNYYFTKRLCLELVFSKCMWNQIGNLKIIYKSINFIVLTTWLFSLDLWSTIILFVYCMLV